MATDNSTNARPTQDQQQCVQCCLVYRKLLDSEKIIFSVDQDGNIWVRAGTCPFRSAALSELQFLHVVNPVIGGGVVR